MFEIDLISGNVAVVVTLLIDIGNGVVNSFSSPARYLLTYAYPVLSSLYHEGCLGTELPNTTALHTCPRSGGGNLTISGTNLGEEGGIVMIGATICQNLQHFSSSQVQCELPPGLGAENSVLFIQKGGAMSYGEVSIGYEQCPPGTYENAGETNCTNCEAGKYTISYGQYSCIECDSGTYAGDGEVCSDCPAGSYSNPGASTCSLCPIGKYSAQARSFVCLACSAGTYVNATNQSACIPCESGRFQAAEGEDECEACAPGSYTSNITTKFDCVACPPGQWQDEYGQGACELCQLGRFGSALGAVECTDCTSGRYSALEGSFTCASCLPGFYQNDIGQQECNSCHEGQFQPEAEQSACLDCEAGRYVDILASIDCIECSPGTTQKLTGQATCEACSAGRYLPGTGNNVTDCFLCSSGFISIFASASCEECKSAIDFQSEIGQAECLTCPFQAVATANHTICECTTGYYAIPFGQYDLFSELDSDSYLIYEQEFISNPNAPSFNPNEHLGFWCAVCPTGADCFASGTFLLFGFILKYELVHISS